MGKSKKAQFLTLPMHSDVYYSLDEWIVNNNLDISLNGLLRLLISQSISFNWLDRWSKEVEAMKHELVKTTLDASDGTDDGMRTYRVRTGMQSMFDNENILYDLVLAAMAERDICIDELALGHVTYGAR